MGPDPFFRVLVEKKNSLCRRNLGSPATREIQHLKRSQNSGSVVYKLKIIYYSYCNAVIELRG
jgi:hypothetical protein